MKLYAEQIRSYVPAPYRVLGTDGFGRSDTRQQLRWFFEVDRHFVHDRGAWRRLPTSRSSRAASSGMRCFSSASIRRKPTRGWSEADRRSAVAQQEIQIPDIGDAEDVEVIEILASVGAEIATRRSADRDRVRQGVDGSAGDRVGQRCGRSRSRSATRCVRARSSQSSRSSRRRRNAAGARPTIRPRRHTRPVATRLPNANRQSAAPSRRRRSRSPRRFEVRVPDIGDAKDVVVVEVKVKVGQDVAVDDLLVVVESDKASMEIPAPVAGRIASVDVDRRAAPSLKARLLVVIETTRQQVPSASAPAHRSETAQPSPTAEPRARHARRRGTGAAAQSQSPSIAAAPQWNRLRRSGRAPSGARTGCRSDEGEGHWSAAAGF